MILHIYSNKDSKVSIGNIGTGKKNVKLLYAWLRFYVNVILKANNGKFYTVVSGLGIINLVKQVWLKFVFYGSI